MGNTGRRANLIVGIVVAAVVAAAIIAWAAAQLATPGASLRAIVHDGDGNTLELPLSEDSEHVVTTSLGTNVVVVKDGAAYMKDADCEGHDCLHQAAISKPGQQIICLPHRLWIEIVEDGRAGGRMDVDAVTGSSENLDAISR